jgi:hypothetical protein
MFTRGEERGSNEIAGLMPGFFAAIPLVFKDLWGLPTGQDVHLA